MIIGYDIPPNRIMIIKAPMLSGLRAIGLNESLEDSVSEFRV